MSNRSNIIYNVSYGVGWIKLDRPNALNALTYEMIETLYRVLQEWKNDDSVAFVCLEGEGDKAFCAGGDVRAFYNLRKSKGNIEEYAIKFFETEYKLNFTMFCYPKPILVFMNGIVMGGGVGISFGCSHRVVTENTKWAMPEMNIGFYPDVGASYFLSRMPSYIGRYLALTTEIIDASDVLHIGAGNYYINSDSWENLKESIRQVSWSKETAREKLDAIIDGFKQSPSGNSFLCSVETGINRHFSFDSIEKILESLKQDYKKGDQWPLKVARTLLLKPPTSLKVTLKQLIEGKNKMLSDCFEMELKLSMNFIKSHDFYEGVRAVLVDKDRSPIWNPDLLSKVEEKDVQTYFEYN